LRLALSHDRQNGGARRWSAAWGKTIVNCERWRDVGQEAAKKEAYSYYAQDQRNLSSAHLPMGQRTRQTEMTVGVVAHVKSAVQKRADREEHRQEQAKRQKTGKCRFDEGAKAELFSLRAHVFLGESSTPRGFAQVASRPTGAAGTSSAVQLRRILAHPLMGLQ